MLLADRAYDSDALRTEMAARGLPGGLPIPWQEFVELVDRMFGDASKHIGEPCLEIDVVHARSLDQV